GDFGSFTWAPAEIELVVADGLEPVSLRGLRAVLEHWRRFLGAWEGQRLVVDGYRELDERRVLVLVRAGASLTEAGGAEPGLDRGPGEAGTSPDPRTGSRRSQP